MVKPYLLMVFIVPSLFGSTASAYLGPGMGGGVFAATVGVVGSIFLALFGVLYYPLKRSIRNKQLKQEQEDKKKQEEDNKKEESPKE